VNAAVDELDPRTQQNISDRPGDEHVARTSLGAHSRRHVNGQAAEVIADQLALATRRPRSAGADCRLDGEADDGQGEPPAHEVCELWIESARGLLTAS